MMSPQKLKCLITLAALFFFNTALAAPASADEKVKQGLSPIKKESSDQSDEEEIENIKNQFLKKATEPKRSHASVDTPPTSEQKPKVETGPALPVPDRKPESENASSVTPAPPAPAPAPAAHASHAPVNSVSAEQSLKWLMNGNARYVKKTFRADGRSAEDRTRLVKGQKPHAIVLSCSDSRVPPEIVFDQALGEIFVVRVAGEALDASVVASVEYAVEHLGSHLLLVMGHSQCGAVSTALKVKSGDSAGSADLDKLLEDIRPRLKTVKSESPSANLEVESALNADGVARDIVKRSEILRKRVDEGSLTVKSALYRMDTGKVSVY